MHNKNPFQNLQFTPQAALTKLEAKILAHIAKNPLLSRKELSNKRSISTDTVKEYIQKLKKKKLLRRKGSTSAGYWEVKP